MQSATPWANEGFFTNTLPEHWTAFWDGVGEFWTEDVPAWVESTGEKAVTFFTETLPTKWTDFWTGVGDFWTKEVPAWVESSVTSAANFFTVTLPAKWTGFWSGVGDKISGFSPTPKTPLVLASLPDRLRPAEARAAAEEAAVLLRTLWAAL